MRHGRAFLVVNRIDVPEIPAFRIGSCSLVVPIFLCIGPCSPISYSRNFSGLGSFYLYTENNVVFLLSPCINNPGRAADGDVWRGATCVIGFQHCAVCLAARHGWGRRFVCVADGFRPKSPLLRERHGREGCFVRVAAGKWNESRWSLWVSTNC